MKTLEVAIIGGGPAGMAAAIKLRKLGVENLLLFERNSFLGGILTQCIHPGFGLRYFKEELTGPEFGLRLIEQIKSSEIPYRLNSMVINLENKELTVSSKDYGLEKYKVKSVIFATGCRERTRENLEIPGTRPSGVYTAGLAQTLINIHNYRIGNRVIIQGSGDIGLIMARRLIIEGYEVIAVLERLPYLSGLIRNKVQCLDHFNIPLYLSTEITEIFGQDRVDGVHISPVNQHKKKTFIECDTILFSVGLIPELELPKRAGIEVSNNFNPDVNSKLEGSVDGIFFCGNCMHINDLADTAAKEGEGAADAAFQYLMDKKEFNNTVILKKPYKEKPNKTCYDLDFFIQLAKSSGKVCIVCPKSCILLQGDYGCEKGEHYFNISKDCNKQRMATTHFGSDLFKNPIISDSQLPVSDFKEIKKRLELNFVQAEGENIKISFKGETISFTKALQFTNIYL